MASSSSTREETALVTTEAKMVVATGRDHCQQLKDMLRKEDSSSMLVVMASSSNASTPDPPSPPRVMDPRLLSVASSGSWQKLESFLTGPPPSQPPAMDPTSNDGAIGSSRSLLESFLLGWRRARARQRARAHGLSGGGTTGSSAIELPSRDEEAQIREAFLEGLTVQGYTFLHVMATKSIGDNLDKGSLIHRKAVEYLSKQYKDEDTPLHCAARAGKSQMVSFLIELARSSGADKLKALLETKNHSGWTVLHEAVRVGDPQIVKVLMDEHPALASIPKDGTSPMYLAILMEDKVIAKALHDHDDSKGIISYSGPKGQNALHAAVLRSKDLTEMLLGWNNALTIQQDENGSTPLHLAAAGPVQGWPRDKIDRRAIYLLLLEANLDQLYQPDNDGLFPIHVAASVGATRAIRDFVKKSPDCAALRDARGRTFLHVAVDQIKIWIVHFACSNQSLSWILNMQDNNGSTALHLAVKSGNLTIFCYLFGNRQVHLSLTNEKGETPLDIARLNLPMEGLYYIQNSEVKIHRTLKIASAKRGICRNDYLETSEIVQARQDEITKREMVKDSTQNLSIVSVLIATVTFGATFAMPGGYRADDHTNGGTPTLAGRYAFDAFIVANALAFTFSVMATVGLMSSGSPMYSLPSRVLNLQQAFSAMLISVTCLVAAFALATYIMLAPVAHKAAITVCVLSSLVLLHAELELANQNAILFQAKYRRRLGNNIVLIPVTVIAFICTILVNLWPIVVIVGLSALKYTGRKVEPAAQPPTPLA